jgi:hypothetical protein
VDSLKRLVGEGQRRVVDVNTKLLSIIDSVSTDKTRLKPMMVEKITALKNMYAEEPFEPERVKRAVNEIVSLREDALPPLREILIDKKIDKHVRVLAISLLGNIANAGASDILLDVLSQTQDPEIKIEILIALGKMKETRAEYVLEQLANDPVDEVAFTAQEVLRKLTKQTGMKLSPDLKMRKVAFPDSSVVPESKIQTRQKDTASAQKVQAAAAQPASAPKPAAAAKAPAPAQKQVPQPEAKPLAQDTAKMQAGAAPAGADAAKKKSEKEDVWGMADSAKAGSAQPPVPKDQAQAAPAALKTEKPDSAAPPAATAKPDGAKKGADKKAKEKKPSAAPKPKPAPAQPEDPKNW